MADESKNSSLILILEEDQTLSGVIKYNLSKEGYIVLSAADGKQAIEITRAEKPDLILLDLILPKMDGLEVCRALRKESDVPILRLIAKSEEADRQVSLEPGGDDYMFKPFGVRELVARVRTMLRRRQLFNEESEAVQNGSCVLQNDSFKLDQSSRKVMLKGNQLELTHKEYQLLSFLIKNSGQTFKREQLLDKVWGYDYAGDTRTVDVHISCLRHKIEAEPRHPQHLITVKGVGYKFEK